MGHTRRSAERKLRYSEESRGHARARHAAPTCDAGPSIDAYLKARMGRRAAEGSRMSAFYNDRDQDRAVAFALDQTGQHATRGTRTTMRVRTDGTLNNITVRIVERVGDTLEGYDAKLREVMVIVDHFNKSGEIIVTAYPSDSYRV